ncbi:exodeoxyribonuclease V subunit gamma [Psychrobium sp. MM17-31]|uniref:exodeoxyribonuclease V subunit gamma n=1 Tax=Psychrobium sp. MM17-31 TaxID=2917758 RepID=UPI001EF40A5A|nr:exodeoxyribonuclease V subunit gamma [Psychrobium sp. MM17-31]
MFRLYHSNKLDVLKSILAHIISQQPLANPFESEKILVQSPGMAQWLKLELAKEFGICANVAFPLPASFIWQTFVDLLPDVPERSAFNKDAMAWQIIKLLPQYLQQQEFDELNNYLTDDEPLKLYQLAYKVADIFDQYLVYRPQWIEAWQNGDFSTCRDKLWQGILWRKLFEVITASGQSHYHRANLYEHLLTALDSKDAAKKLPKRIFVFGISALPPKYLQALKMMAQHCEVHFFLNNPCQHYWGDIVDQRYLAKLSKRQYQQLNLDDFSEQVAVSEQPQLLEEQQFNALGELTVGNPLLASMGKLGRDNLALLLELEAQEVDAFVPSEQRNLLDLLNDDILELQDSSFIPRTKAQLSDLSPRRIIADDDDSIVIHDCHSPMREVEVLRDQILAVLHQDPTLTPKDIVVMMPDVNAYSPYIQAVFSHSHNYIDFSISDRSAAQEHPILLSFLTLMSLTHLRKSASELFSLLEVPAIMAKFELTASDIDGLKRWIDESGIRQGLGEQGVYTNSWLFGLNRMLKGYSQSETDPLQNNGGSLWQDILAYPETVGLAAETLGQLSYFVELISKYSAELLGDKTIEQWQHLIANMLNDLYSESAESESELAIINDALAALAQELTLADYRAAISHEVLLAHLQSKLETGASSQRFLAGKLNFCTLMPMRSIPFRVVCILGMNDGVYPRSIAPIGFDLMANQHQKGDRSRRDDDRYLFLEAMLSAQDKLYLSYCGRSIKDNSERCASVLLNEVIDYISLSYRLASDQELDAEAASKSIIQKLVCKHPLTPFSPLYYNGETQSTDAKNKLFSYQRDWLGAHNKAQQEDHLAAQSLQLLIDSNVIAIEQLTRFIKHPAQYFFNQRLGVYFNDEDGELLDSEPFAPDGLVSYQVKQQLLEGYIHHADQSTQRHVRALGVLPHAHFADLFLTEQQQVMSPLASAIKPYLTAPSDDVEVDIAINSHQQRFAIQGWLKEHYNQRLLVRYKPGKANAKFFVECYVQFLCFCVVSPHQQSQMAMFTQDGQWLFNAITQQEAHLRLTALVDMYIEGLTKPLPLALQSGWRYLDTRFDEERSQLVDDEKTIEKANRAFKDRFNGNMRIHGEGQDAYLARCVNGANFEILNEKLQTQMIELALAVLLPVRQLLETVDD